MPITLLTTDYSGRKKDIHIMQGVDPSKLSSISPSFGKISNFCTGVQKLIQRYSISLLTAIGSQPNYPNFGTQFIPSLLDGSTRLNIADITTLFNLSNIKVMTTFLEYQKNLTGVPDDEKLNNATLSKVSVIDNNVYLTIKLTPVRTDSVVFVLPLPV